MKLFKIKKKDLSQIFAGTPQWKASSSTEGGGGSGGEGLFKRKSSGPLRPVNPKPKVFEN